MNLMQEALIHSSMYKQYRVSNERLEFLGDSVLQLLVTQWLYITRPEATEDQLSKHRARLVCKANLVCVANRLKLGERLIVGSQVEQITENMLADGVEAQIGAMYLTYGLDKTRQWVYEHIILRQD